VDPLGDFQTPAALAIQVVQRLARLWGEPGSVVEPTCGRGVFLQSAAARFPGVSLLGVEANSSHVEIARQTGAQIVQADAFAVDWEVLLAGLPEPIWVVGNPPWVTASALGTVGAINGPARSNPGLKGFDALTGAANFDLSEWLLLHLAQVLRDRDARIGLLCKTSTARRVLGQVCAEGLWRLDARRWFEVSVAAGLFACRPGPPAVCPVFDSLDASGPAIHWTMASEGVRAGDGAPELEVQSDPAWRSGLKHDCAAVMELRRVDGGWKNRAGRSVSIEPERRAPFAKASDLHHGRSVHRAIVLTQRHPSEDTAALERTSPRTWAYLLEHAERLDARRSRVWRGRPRFGLFGVGPYSFAPWKVAVSGLHEALHFRVLGPVDGQPVLLDDTSYFLPYTTEQAARDALARLQHPRTRAFLAARTFPDAKRKITARRLQRLDLSRVELAKE